MKKIFLTLFLLIAVLGSANAQTVDFAKANAAYRDGKYDDAVSGYETILKGGSESGPLYYNLGNSYFKKQQLGKAIVNYERALRLMPRDIDIAANHKFALSEVQNRVTRSSNMFDAIWDKHIHFYSMNEMIVIILVLLILAAVAHLATLYLNWKTGRLVMAVIIALFVIFVYGAQVKVGAERGGGIVIIATSARFEPNDRATVYFELPQGQDVKVRERESGWVKIERPDGKAGWVQEDSVERI